MAVCSAFIYRYAALKNKLNKLLSIKCIALLGFLHIGYQIPTIVFHDMAHVDRAIIDNAILTVCFCFYGKSLEYYYSNGQISDNTMMMDVHQFI